MKKNTKKNLMRIASASVSFALVGAVVCSQIKDTVGVVQAAMTVSGTLKDVTGEYSTDTLRKSYFNENVQKNTLNENDERWVIVGFDGNSIIDDYKEEKSALEFSEYVHTERAMQRQEEVAAKHETFLNSLDAKGIDYQFKYSYSTLNNGVAIKVKRKHIDTISGMSGVTGVEYSESYAFPQDAVSNNANVYTTGIYKTDGIDYKGAGMKVAVLDTGLDYTHSAFANMPADKGKIWIEDDVEVNLDATEAAKRTSGLTIDQVYYNEKVPFAYDYADDDPDVYPSYSEHGTHVAGIIAGRDDNKYVNPNDNTETFKGVAPEAQLVICKVFTDNLNSDMLGGADTVDILAALTDCVTLGVDVINMSLGSSCGFSFEDKTVGDFTINEVYDSIEEMGISLVVAASNDYSSGFGGGNGTNLASNPDSATVGSPATYSASLAVASINGKTATYFVGNQTSEDDESNVAFVTEASDGNGNKYDFMEQLYESEAANPLRKPKTEKLTLNYVVIGGVGKPGNYTSSIKRKLQEAPTIALVKRGDITFAEKVENAMAEGAVACVIYNNVSGTISMSLGEVENPIPTCSIGMDEGKMLVDGATKNSGTITFSYDYKAGPFMSEFSSWGPTPDLKLKPEITAHGGEITSAVPGGYAEQSGTSMASPNMAGAATLLREHISLVYGKSGWELNAMVNQLAMSTTTMALNPEGNPYSPRKQGAGLANIKDAINTEGYITVKDENGQVANKTKLELGDDDERTGIYTLNFTVNNLTDKPITYKPNVYVMTETLATDLKTVAEKAYMLNDSLIYMSAGGQAINYGENITVSANGALDVTIRIELGVNGRQYIEDSFKNGMYIEGYARLEPVTNATVEIGVPYLGFYGDWADAPLFDYSMYELAETDADPSIEEEDKPKATASSTRPFGYYDDDQYIIPLGAYLYAQSEEETEVFPSEDKAAISMYDMEGRRTVYEFYLIYAGLLRGAKTLQVDITNKTTGELIYSKLEKNMRKSYAAGGSNIGAPVMLEIAPDEWDMHNNTVYTLTMNGTLDCEGGEKPAKDSFTFDFTIDTESPVIRDYRIRFEPYTENKETKYRIYMDVDVYDNQYTMSIMPCYTREVKGEKQLTLLTEYPIPTYSEKATEKTVSFEITDYYETYVKTGKMIIAVDDYALNQTLYEVNAPSATIYPTDVSVNCDEKLTLKESGVSEANTDESLYNVYQITLAPNEVYKVTLDSSISGTLAQSLVWRTSNGNVKAEKSELFALETGTTVVDICSAYNSGAREEEDTYTVKARIIVTVEGEAKADPIAESIGFAPVLVGAAYLVDPDNVASSGLELHPNQSVQFNVETKPWYVPLELEWSSTNEDIFTVDQNGVVTTKKKGRARLEVKAKGYDRLQKSVLIIVGEEFNIISYTLYDYYGGPEVIIPDDKNIMYLHEECFQGNTTITKVVLPETLYQIPEYAFMGCTSLEEVVIPAKCTLISYAAFMGCTSLRKVTLSKAEDKITGDLYIGSLTLGGNVFSGCTNLSEITNQKRITTAHNYAFSNCESLTSIDITELRIAGRYVFNNCKNLETVYTDEDTPLGAYMFSGCTKLTDFVVKADRIEDGVFNKCTNLANVTFTSDTIYGIGASAFNSTAIKEIVLPNGTYVVGKNAFENCKKLEKVTISSQANVKFAGATFAGCTAFDALVLEGGDNARYSVENNILYNADKTTIELVPSALQGSVTIANNVEAIGDSVFAGTSLTSIDLNNVTKIGDYAFANAKLQTVDLSNVTEIGAYAFSYTLLQTVDLTGIEEIKDGTFIGCHSLETITGIDSVTSIGASAFSNCDALDMMTITFPELISVGTQAFAYSSVTRFTANKLETIGEKAFTNSDIRRFNAPSVSTIGAKAFYMATELQKAEFGDVTEMGEGVFLIETTETAAVTGNLEEVVFGEGTTVIGENAFLINVKDKGYVVGWLPRYSLSIVELPDTVKTIGAYAFTLATNVEELNLVGVEEIGELACYGVGIKSADLRKARIIGASAFRYATLNTVQLDALEQIGSLAFANTNITEIEIPNIETLTFDDHWLELTAGGNWEEVTGKKTARIMGGAFSGMASLKTVKVKGEGKLSVIDNVLYMDTAEGKVLVLYPAMREGGSYTPVKNTVRIDDYAFYNTSNLTSVTMPYTVKAIGSYAFFNDLKTPNKTINSFVFEGVEAPILEAAPHQQGYATYDIVEDGVPKTYLEDFCGWAQGLYYTNFKGYFHEVVDPATLNPSEESVDFKLKITYPENGIGYNTPVWKNYFKTTTKSAYAAEYVTRQAIEAIAALPTVEEIQAATASGYEAIKAISEQRIQPARALYNQIQSTQQIALITEYGDLLAVEKAIRDAKATLGQPAKLTEFKIVKNPDKVRYVGGESFDPTGMIVKVVYDDMSELEVTDYSMDQDVLYSTGNINPVVDITLYYQDKTCKLSVIVEGGATGPESEDPAPVNPTDPTQPKEDSNVGLIIGLAAGGVALVAAGIVVFFLLKKKKVK